MRINKFVALATGISRRSADVVIDHGRVKVNGRFAKAGQAVTEHDRVTLDNHPIAIDISVTTIILNKPKGYVSSRSGQGSKTIYDLLPSEFYNLKPVGRLDKDSSGLLLLTNDGKLAHRLTHPSFQKKKVYEVEFDRALSFNDKRAVEEGIELEDGISKLQLSGKDKNWIVIMYEGRNRQIRRTFAVLGYRVTKLHRIQFGEYSLNKLTEGDCLLI